MSQEENNQCQDTTTITKSTSPISGATCSTNTTDVKPEPAGKSCYYFLFYQHKGLPALSVVIILTSVVLKYLTEFKLTLGLSSSSSSGESNQLLLWGSFLIYSLGLIWISVHFCLRFGNPSGASGRNSASTIQEHSPTTLARLRSHLTFLPIIHLIRQRPVAAGTPCNDGDISSSNNNGLGNGSNGGALSSNDEDDKEYLSKLEFQRDTLIDAILDNYVFPWYERISDEKTFPVQSKRILQTSFDRLAKKFRQMDRTLVAREAIEVIHYHWKTYLDAAKKGPAGPDGGVEQHFQYLHSFLDSREQLSKHYESLTSILLNELLIPDLKSHLICRFLAGIIVKGFILYYFELISNPKWINYSIMSLLSSGTLNSTPPCGDQLPISNGSSRESLCDLSSTCKCGCMESSSLSHPESESSLPTDTQPSSSRPSADISSSLDKDLTIISTQDNKTPEESSSNQDTGESVIVTTGGSKNGPEDVKATNGKKAASVSAALGGLLSTTALPLLPEGYNLHALPKPLQGIEQQQQQQLQQEQLQQDYLSKMGKDETGKNEDSPRVIDGLVKAKGEDESKLPTEISNETDDSNKYTSATPKTSSTATTPVQNMNRHLSLEDGPKSNPALGSEKGTKSLDESKANCSVQRQDEFDLGGDNTLKPGAGLPAKSDISPTYDEAEDFAATIAKLRSLLEQRESRKDLHEDLQNNDNGEADVFHSNESADSQEKAKSSEEQLAQLQQQKSMAATSPQPIRRITESVRPSLNSQSSASSLGSDGSSGSTTSQSSLDAERLEKIVDELEESGPQVNRFFINVAIPKTETCSESSGQFVLYSIQYEGVYLEENDDGQLEKLVLRTTTIKRRFQEFLTLHNHLEENPLWRPHIKGIKAPSKWLNLSFAKSESANTAQKKSMLERYLHQLCYHPVLGFCPHLRQFMAYGEEGFYAFVAPDAIPLHRFDKIAKKFTGVFNSVRDALPSFEIELLAVPSSPDMTSKSPTENKGKSLFASFLRAEKSSPSVEKIEDAKHDSQEETSKSALEGNENEDSNFDSNGNGKADNGDNNTEAKEEVGGDPASNATLLDEPLVEAQMDAVYPLAVAATQLLCDVLWLPHHRPHSASVSAFLSISGKSFENYIQEFLEDFFSQEAILGYLEAATMAIQDWAKEDGTVAEPEMPGATEEELKNCLRQKIPVWVRWMWGRSRVDVTIDRLTKVCQDTQINQDVILSLVELLFSKIVDVNLDKEAK